MKTSETALLMLLLTVAVMTSAVEGHIESSSQQHEQDRQQQGRQEPRGVPAPGPGKSLERTYACSMPLCPRPCCQTLPSDRSCPSCPEPRCPEPVCPQPFCPAPVCPPAPQIPPCPNVSCPKPMCPEPRCPTVPSPPTSAPCPKCADCTARPATLSCPQHVCPKTQCPKPVSPTCPPPPKCATQPPPVDPKGICRNCLLKVLNTYDRHKGFGFYKAYRIRLTWHEANATCDGDGSHLGIINSEKEAEIYRLLYKKERLAGWVFIGFHDLYSEGDFRTVLGGSLSNTGYTKWYPRQPNNAGTENCGTIDRRALLNDGKCHWKLFFICEAPESQVLGTM